MSSKERNANETAVTTTANELPPVELALPTLEHLTSADLANGGQRGGSGSLSLNVVYSESNGKRIKLSQALHEGLGSPTQLQVAKSGNTLFIAESIPSAREVFKFSPGKGKTIIYNAALVQWLIDAFSLDYEGRVSRSYSKTELVSGTYNGSQITYAVIEMD